LSRKKSRGMENTGHFAALQPSHTTAPQFLWKGAEHE
jgi:hypothetical protein